VIRIRTVLANGPPQADRLTLSTVPDMKAVDRPVRDIPRDAFSEVPGALPTCWAFCVGKTLSALMLYSYARARARFFPGAELRQGAPK
jgi:hypothetical protein